MCITMRNITLLLILVLCLFVGKQVWASESLAKQNGCMGCHADSQKIVGPSWQDVAVKYKGQPDAAKKLSESIVKGSTGKWGQIPMPPQAQLSAADALTIASWVLARP
jgi:cytochrome c